MDINEINLYKDSAREKIIDLSKQITKLKRSIEDLEESIEHNLSSKLSSKIRSYRSKKLEKKNKKLENLELKLETYKFDNLKDPEETPDIDTTDYLEYQNKLLNHAIKKVQIKKNETLLPVSKWVYSKSINKIKKQIHKNDLGIIKLQRKQEDIAAKELDENIAKQRFKESKKANTKAKENKSKIPTNQANTEAAAKPGTSEAETSQANTEAVAKPSTSEDIQSSSKTIKVSSINGINSGGSDNINKVTNIDYSTMSLDNFKSLSKLISVNTKIYTTLKKISDNQIDEQDTTIKLSKERKKEPILVSQKDEEQPKKEDSLLSKLLGFASILFGMGIDAPKMLFKYMLKSVKSSLKFFLKPFLTPIKLAIKDVYKLVAPLVNLVSKLSKSVLKIGTKIGTKIGSKIGTKISTKIEDLKSSKIGSKIGSKIEDLKSSKIGSKVVKVSEKAEGKVGNIAKTSEKIAVKTTSKFALAAKSVKSSKSFSIFGWIGKKVSSAIDIVKKKGLEFTKKLILPFIEKLIGKKGLKLLIKVLAKIPGVSILTGLGFAAYDIAKGDYAHAAVDVLSGIVGSIPWVGPILGIATSAVGDLIIDKYRKSKVQSKTNIKSKVKFKTSADSKNSTKNINKKTGVKNSYIFESMVQDEISNIKQDPSFLPKEIKYYNNKNKTHIPVITINDDSYTDKTGKEIKIDNLYRLRKAYAKYIVASSQNMNNSIYKRQILEIMNKKLYTGNVKISSEKSSKSNNYVSLHRSTGNIPLYNSDNAIKSQNVPELIFSNNQVQIGSTMYPSNPKIKRDYDNYKIYKSPENIKNILEDIKMLKNATQKKDNTYSKIQTLSSIFNNNQQVLNTKKSNNIQHTNPSSKVQENHKTNHINIVQQPQKESARLMNIYQ